MKFPYNKALEIRRQFKLGEITREQATEQLGFILDLDDKDDMCPEAAPKDYKAYSYGPLLRLSDVCAVLRTWAKVAGQSLPGESEYRKKERWTFCEHWGAIDLAISKSNLLARLFFGTDNVREEPCPTHKGRWSGCDFKTGKDACRCNCGGNVTGWLPGPGDWCDQDHE